MQEMKKIMANMRPTFLFIYENFLRLWFVIQSIIVGIRFFAPKMNDFLWDFNVAFTEIMKTL